MLTPEEDMEIAALKKRGWSISAIARHTGRDRKTVRAYLNGEQRTRSGMIYVRGDQIAGEYATGSVLDEEGWFCTRDHGFVDEAGYLFIEGRADDTIIRGGENITPAEIEEVLLDQPGITDACVVGLPDDEWGQRIVAVVVADGSLAPDEEQLRSVVKSRLRGSKTPDAIVFRDELPHTDTGKLLRRVVSDELQRIGETR